MKKQMYWDCHTTGDDTTRKAYTKDGKQRVKVTRTITRDCATGIADDTSINEAFADPSAWTEERTLEEWMSVLAPIVRKELRRYLSEHPESMPHSR